MPKLEKIDVEPVVLKKIAARSQGDVRSALTDLDVLTKQKGKIRNEDVYNLFREREESIFYAGEILTYVGPTHTSKRC